MPPDFRQQFNQQYQDLLDQYGNGLIATASILSLIFTVLFCLRYIQSNTEHGLGTKLLDLLLMYFYFMLLPIYIVVGVVVTRHAAIGVCVGIAAFWGMLEFKNFVKRRRIEKNKQKRMAELEKQRRH